MTVHRLARVRWSVGQVLLPEHFRALESSLAGEAGRRVDLLGLPANGLAVLEWNGDAPRGGVLSVRALSFVLPTGELVEAPGNADITGPLDLGAVKRSDISVYAHVLDAPTTPVQGEAPTTPDDVPRAPYRLEISAEPNAIGSRGRRLFLGQFTQKPGSGFTLSKARVPPLLLVGTNPWLRDLLADLRDDLVGFEGTLADLVAEEEDEDDDVDSVRAAQRARIEALRMSALLDDLDAGISLHPYTLFSTLRGFFLELCLLEGAIPELPLARYTHEDPGPCFQGLIERIREKLARPPLRTPNVPLVRSDGVFVAKDLPPVLLSAKEVYLMLRRPSPEQRVSLDGVRVASPSRLRVVHERALRGVKIVPSPKPPFRHGFGPGVDFYRLVSASEEPSEWRHVVEERALCFHEKQQLAGVDAALFWRNP